MRQFVLRIENYVPLITDISASHWLKLPNKTKSWMGQDDFIQDGVQFARFELMPKYDPGRGAKFSTYMFIPMHRFFKAYRESLTCEKRWMTKGAIIELYDRSRFKEELYVVGQDGIDSINKLYDAASDNLKGFMEDWFFSVTGPKRVVKSGTKFKRARLEFLERAQQFNVTIELCAQVLQSSRMGLYEPELLRPTFPDRGLVAR